MFGCSSSFHVSAQPGFVESVSIEPKHEPCSATCLPTRTEVDVLVKLMGHTQVTNINEPPGYVLVYQLETALGSVAVNGPMGGNDGGKQKS